MLFEKQNRRLDIQNHLVESQRRASQYVELSAIMDRISEELYNADLGTEGEKKNFQLSNILSARIVALSRTLKPYRLIIENSNNNITLSKPISPERGQLLISLATSDTLNHRILTESNFTYSELTNAVLKGVNLTLINLQNSDISNSDLSHSILHQANFGTTNLSHSNLKYCILSNADFSGADLQNANLTSAQLNVANFSNKKGTIPPNYTAVPRLTSANLTNAKLIGVTSIECKFTGANLSNADFSKAKLDGSDFSSTNLSRAIFLKLI